MPKIRVGVLGATGMVGQHVIARLSAHPWFELGSLAASSRSAGRSFGEAARWLLPGDPPDGVLERRVVAATPEDVPDRIVISALDRGPAAEIEPRFAEAGRWVLTNASAYRLHGEVPLVVPEVNADHVEALRGRSGGIVANPNCTATPVVMALAALAPWGIEAVTVASWQAVSGAGYPGDSAYDLIGNARPHPGDEEEKLAAEPRKMLGSVDRWADFALSARCVRVPVVDGHLVAVHVRTQRRIAPDEAIAAFRSLPAVDLPSAPIPPLRVAAERDRPSARWDAGAGDGMAVTIGRVEPCPVLGLKFFALAHNAVRGAAGAALLNAELLVTRGITAASSS
jgi:aspartate-semialdehyde dehydrogenase